MPFLDGNGRVGRLLITLIFCVEKVLREPLLYLSLYFKRHRDRYYSLLDQVRTQGDWEEWVEFFSHAVHETADSAVVTARAIEALFADDRQKVRTTLLRKADSALRVHEALQKRPVDTISGIAARTGLSVPTIAKALDGLESLGIVRETTGQKRYRVYIYSRYIGLLDSDQKEDGREKRA